MLDDIQKPLTTLINIFNINFIVGIILFSIVFTIGMILFKDQIKYLFYSFMDFMRSFIDRKSTQKSIKDQQKQSSSSSPRAQLSIQEAQEVRRLLNDIIKEKFNFYLINELLPMYYGNKKPDKNDINELQERFFTDVSLLITKDLKKIFLKYYTTEGIKIYINEQFLYYVNKIDKAFYTDQTSIVSDDLYKSI